MTNMDMDMEMLLLMLLMVESVKGKWRIESSFSSCLLCLNYCQKDGGEIPKVSCSFEDRRWSKAELAFERRNEGMKY